MKILLLLYIVESRYKEPQRQAKITLFSSSYIIIIHVFQFFNDIFIDFQYFEI